MITIYFGFTKRKNRFVTSSGTRRDRRPFITNHGNVSNCTRTRKAYETRSAFEQAKMMQSLIETETDLDSGQQ